METQPFAEIQVSRGLFTHTQYKPSFYHFVKGTQRVGDEVDQLKLIHIG